MRQFLVVGAASLALAMSVLPASAKCVLAGGEATMVTVDLAKFMAKAALKNSISGMGMKPSGEIKLKCDSPVGLPHCVARQRACS